MYRQSATAWATSLWSDGGGGGGGCAACWYEGGACAGEMLRSFTDMAARPESRVFEGVAEGVGRPSDASAGREVTIVSYWSSVMNPRSARASSSCAC